MHCKGLIYAKLHGFSSVVPDLKAWPMGVAAAASRYRDALSGLHQDWGSAESNGTLPL